MTRLAPALPLAALAAFLVACSGGNAAPPSDASCPVPDAAPPDAGPDAEPDAVGCACEVGHCCDGCDYRPAGTVCADELVAIECDSQGVAFTWLRWACTERGTCEPSPTAQPVSWGLGCGGASCVDDGTHRPHCPGSTDPCDTGALDDISASCWIDYRTPARP